MRKFMLFIAGCLITLGIISCGNMLIEDDDGLYIVVDELDSTNTAQIPATLHVHLSNYASATWYIDDDSSGDTSNASGSAVVTVSSDFYGATLTLVTKAAGTVTISAVTAADNEYRYTLQVEDRIIVEADSSMNDFVTVGAVLTARMGSNAAVSWSVSDRDVAELTSSPGSAQLKIKQVGNGKVTLTAVSNGKSYSFDIAIANIIFKNTTEYKATVRRDALSGEVVAEILPSGSWIGYVPPSPHETMFYFGYSALLVDDADYGTVWVNLDAGVNKSDDIDSSTLKTETLSKNIPSPEKAEFTAIYLKIYNKSNKAFSLYKGSLQIKTETDAGVLNVQPGKTGVYNISGYGQRFEGFEIEASGRRIPIEYSADDIPMGIYECAFTDSVPSLSPTLKK